jgi:hypothetical protein
MSLKDNWEDKVDGVDDVVAETTNQIAGAVIELEETIGEIDTALDTILAKQASVLGG